MNDPAHAPALHIGRLHLRAPGTSRADGEAIARHLSDHLARLPADLPSTHLGALQLRLPAGPETTPDAIAQAVANALQHSLQRPSATTDA